MTQTQGTAQQLHPVTRTQRVRAQHDHAEEAPTTMSETPALMTRSEIKAAQAALKAATAATRKAETRKATTVARAVIKNFDEHAFTTGSKGRSVRTNVEIDGRKAFLNVTLVFSDTVTKKDKAEAEASA